MNKLTKIGVSALCGSLAAVSAANAGSMAVGGSANATWSKLGYGETGNPIGMATWLTFVGSGELDNGSTFSVTIAHDDDNAYSTSNISLTTPGMGTFKYDEGGGTGLDRLDDKMPTAWEETTGTAVGTGIRNVSGVGGVSDIEWTLPTMADGLNIYASYSPKPDGSAPNDKSVGGDNGTGTNNGSGYDLVLEHTGLMDGLSLFGGVSTISQGSDTLTDGDRKQSAIGATYAVGGFTLGYQWSEDNTNLKTSTDYYENNIYGVSFNVSDDLTISYGVNNSDRIFTSGQGTNQETEASSFQLSYSMGGASVKIAETSVDNWGYQTTTAFDRDGTTISLSLAF